MEASDLTRTSLASQIVRYGVGTLRAITFMVLLIVYLVWVWSITGQTLGGSFRGPEAFSGLWLTAAFLVSLSAFSYLCTAQDKTGNFVGQSVVVTLLFLSYGVASGFVLLLGLAFSVDAASFHEGAVLGGTLSPLLTVGVAMILATVVRLAMVWEPAPTRLKAAKRWLFLAPPILFLLSQVLPFLTRLGH
ncbi:hypothetical protein [Arthrobacter psychrolactophilus]